MRNLAQAPTGKHLDLVINVSSEYDATPAQTGQTGNTTHSSYSSLFVAKSLGGCPGDALITRLDEKIGLYVREDETLHSCTHSHQQGARPPLKTGAGDAAKKIIAGAFFWCTTWCTAH